MIRAKSIVLAASAAAVLLASGTAHAHSVPALSGHAYWPSEQSCFFPPSSWAGVSNRCANTAALIVPLQNTTNTPTAQLAVYVNVSSPGITCTGYQVRSWGNLVTSHASNPNASGRVLVGYFANVLPADTLHLVCSMPPSGASLLPRLLSVEW